MGKAAAASTGVARRQVVVARNGLVLAMSQLEQGGVSAMLVGPLASVIARNCRDCAGPIGGKRRGAFGGHCRHCCRSIDRLFVRSCVHSCASREHLRVRAISFFRRSLISPRDRLPYRPFLPWWHRRLPAATTRGRILCREFVVSSLGTKIATAGLRWWAFVRHVGNGRLVGQRTAGRPVYRFVSRTA